MQFWKKTYFVVLILFLLFFNGGIFAVTNTIYQSNLGMEKERALNEHYFISVSLSKECYALEQRGKLDREMMVILFQNYADHYRKSDIYLELWYREEEIASTAPKLSKERKELDLQFEKRNTIIRTINGEKYLYIAGNLSKPYEAYKFVYVHDLSELELLWNQVIKLASLGSFVVSLILAMILYMILKKMTKPLTELAHTAKIIGEGNYQKRVSIKGKDEIALLGGQFNHMADEVGLRIKRIEEESNQKQQFMDNLAHELRTPLTSIYGYAELMQKVPVTEEERFQFLDYIMKETERLNNLSEQLLKMALLREEEITSEQVSTEILSIQVYATLTEKWKDKKVQLKMILDCDSMFGNAILLESLLLNLGENAIRACVEIPKITFHFFREEERYKIKVSDNGIGMEEKDIENIMEPFYRIDKARSRENGGVGLGLAICKQIVSLHHGEMIVQSEKGKGTIMTVTL